MASMVVGVFDSERLALAAVRALGRAGLGRDSLSLVSRDIIDSKAVESMISHPLRQPARGP